MSTTPMMRQYEQAKAACPGALLLFRMGDFYELFHEDAHTAARLLGLTVTTRDKDKGALAVPMAGFPYHQLESYLGKLVAAGQRVAVCDQVEDPRQAKGIVRREVTRIVTPGTLTDDALLDPRQSNYLAAVALPEAKRRAASGGAPPAQGTWGDRPSPQHHPTCDQSEGADVGLAWVELSTGRFFAASIAAGRLADELARIDPAECLLADDDAPLPEQVADTMVITRRPAWAFSSKTAAEALARHFGTHSLAGFGFDPEQDRPAIAAAGAILEYLAETQRASLAHIDRLIRYQIGTTLEIDESTRRSLEIHRTLRHGRREGSLLAVLDRTVTAMGSRLLAEWVAAPLTDRRAIDQRLDAVDELVSDARFCDQLRQRLAEVHDLERLLSRMTTGRASPRDLRRVGQTLGVLPSIKALLAGRRSDRIVKLEARLDLFGELRTRLEKALCDDCPLSSRDGGFIRAGWHEPLDQLRELASGGKQWIAQYQAAESQRTGIPNLKVGFNKVFGYYLEVTHAQAAKIPEHYIRKQTVKNAERYITPELKEYEERVLTADEKAKELEYQLFVELREAVAAGARPLQAAAAVLGELDVLAALAELARARGYCRPRLVAEPVLELRDARHPVLDALSPEGTFVPNDTLAGPDAGQILLITGPNMAGKSTYIRQVALVVLMAQLGSFVPARQATIGVADRIFARVGASDELSRGQSTFMVEMTETARILNMATAQSLVILDEIGRGTSTYDGVSLAWAIVEHLHDQVGCRTLFATHYHELTDLARTLGKVTNLNVAVREWEERLVFLHKIIEGPADKSYGIHVARLAGVPRQVNERAKQILAQLEQVHLNGGGPRLASRHAAAGAGGDLQLTLFAADEHRLLEQIRRVDLNATTPLEALRLLEAWQAQLNAGVDNPRR